MTPTHQDGYAAARRVRRAYEAGEQPLVNDALTMSTYNLSLELRRVPEPERMAAALQIARRIVANTRESLD